MFTHDKLACTVFLSFYVQFSSVQLSFSKLDREAPLVIGSLNDISTPLKNHDLCQPHPYIEIPSKQTFQIYLYI